MSQVSHHITGPEYWRSLEQLAESPEVARQLEQEFPGYEPTEIRKLSRRRFMKLMGASMALAGLTLSGCRRWPKEKLVAYTSSPMERIPGVAEYYATAYEIDGVAQGLLVRSFDGRPIKVEGNPTHPFSRTASVGARQIGAADAYAQASVLELYDPDRTRGVIDGREKRRASSWEQFAAFAKQHFGAMKQSGGAGLAVLSERCSGPTHEAMREKLLSAFPQARWYEYAPLHSEAQAAGLAQLLGQPARPRYLLDKAEVIVSFDEDLLGQHPNHVRHAADWSARRRMVDAKTPAMNRLYIAESCYSTTGTAADHRLACRPSALPALIVGLAAKLGVGGAKMRELDPAQSKFIELAAADLKAHGKHALVTAGASVGAELQALVHAINAALGAAGETVVYYAEPKSPARTVKDLANDLGAIKTLLILGGNPSYDLPADVNLTALLTGASKPLSIHLSLYDNETSALCTWSLPRAHYLESWGDARAFDGTISVVQPLIEPLFGGKTPAEVLALILGESLDADALVKRTFKEKKLLAGEDFEKAFRKALHDGLVEGSAYATIDAGGKTVNAPKPAAAATGFEVRFSADAKVYDGRFSNSGWLQELPDPLTKLTWDNAALISKKDADALGVGNGDVLRITLGERSMQIPAYILPGQPQGVIGLPLGYGRSAAGAIGNGVGFNAYGIRTLGTMFSAASAKVEKTGQSHTLAMTQDHHLIDAIGAKIRDERVGQPNKSGRVVREATLSEYKAHPDKIKHAFHAPVALPLFDPPFAAPQKDPGAPTAFNDPHAWGMTIDMTVCTGCSACVVACQAENNIPIVGKSQVLMNREMHWLRLDRYFKGEIDAPQVVYQPMTCVHCENAPCEQVCPVAATVHDTEGLNTMVYNRCIGTRYCSNNCPYKVRRFNYFDYHSRDPRGGQFQAPWLLMPDAEQSSKFAAPNVAIKKMAFNPDVTVRMRGVMEKCTYCVQRIKEATIPKRNAGQEIQDGDVVTACQQACPTQAIVFGDLNDAKSMVRKTQALARSYGVLDEDLSTRPRTMHLAKIRNAGGEPSASAEH